MLRRVPLLAAALAALAGAALAQDDGERLSALAARIGRSAGQDVLLDPAFDMRVAISSRIEELPPEARVPALARLIGCEVEELPGGVLFLTDPPRVRVAFDGVDLRRALQRIAADGERDLVVAPGARGRVSLALDDAHWLRALSLAVRAGGLEVFDPGRGVLVVGEAPPAGDRPDPGPAVSVAARDEPLAAVAARLAREAGVVVRVDPALRARVTADLRDVPLRHALGALARLAGCRLAGAGDGALVLAPTAPLRLQAVAAPAPAFLRLLGRAGGLDLEVGADVGGDVTLELSGRPAGEALGVVAWAYGLALERRPGGGLRVEAGGGPLAAGASPGYAERVARLTAEIERLALAGRADALEERLEELRRLVRSRAGPAEPRYLPAEEAARLAARFERELGELARLAGGDDPEALRAALTELGGRLARAEPAVLDVYAAALERRLDAFKAHPSVRRTLVFHGQVQRAAARVRRAEAALGAGDPHRARRELAELEAVAAAMAGHGDPLLVAQAEAFRAQGDALAERAGRLAPLAGHDLRVAALAIVPDAPAAPAGGAVVGGRVVATGGVVVPGEPPLRLVAVRPGEAVLRYGDDEVVRALGAD